MNCLEMSASIVVCLKEVSRVLPTLTFDLDPPEFNHLAPVARGMTDKFGDHWT